MKKLSLSRETLMVIENTNEIGAGWWTDGCGSFISHCDACTDTKGRNSCAIVIKIEI